MSWAILIGHFSTKTWTSNPCLDIAYWVITPLKASHFWPETSRCISNVLWGPWCRKILFILDDARDQCSWMPSIHTTWGRKGKSTTHLCFNWNWLTPIHMKYKILRRNYTIIQWCNIMISMLLPNITNPPSILSLIYLTLHLQPHRLCPPPCERGWQEPLNWTSETTRAQGSDVDGLWVSFCWRAEWLF